MLVCPSCQSSFRFANNFRKEAQNESRWWERRDLNPQSFTARDFKSRMYANSNTLPYLFVCIFLRSYFNYTKIINLVKILNCKIIKNVSHQGFANSCSLFQIARTLYQNSFQNTIHKITKDLCKFILTFVHFV